jgi:Zn-dependent protease
VARRLGQRVERIIFHGFFAETIVSAGESDPRHEAPIALVGPLVNLTLAALAASARVLVHSEAASDVFLLALVLGNLAMAGMSLLPVGGSDGARALRAWRRR